jgi:hypothetical protein
MDGKVINGTGQGGVSTVHLLSLFLAENEGMTNQMAMEPGENEIATVLRLLENSAMDEERNGPKLLFFRGDMQKSHGGPQLLLFNCC